MENNTIYITFFIIILFYIMVNTKSDEKFNDFELVSPIVLKAEKMKTDAFIEWYNDDSRIKEFIILYIDVNSNNKDIWVQKNIKCDKKRCRIILKNLNGKKYNMTILSTHNGRVSRVREIVTFSDDFTYIGIGTTHTPTITAQGDNTPLETDTPSSSNNSPVSNVSEKNNKSLAPSLVESPSLAPSPAPELGPLIDCDGNVIRHNITTEDELKSAKLNYKCNDMSDYKKLQKYVENRPFYYYYWESVFG